MVSGGFDPAAGAPALDIGRVLGGAFAAIRKHWAPFLIYSLALWCLPNLLLRFWNISSNAHAPDQVLAALGNLARALPIGLVFTPIFQALVAWTIWADGMGAPAGLGVAIPTVGRRLVTIFLAYWLFQLAQTVGVILLLVPGIMVLLALQVVVPVCAAEQLSIPEALSRTLFLTRGQRWRLLLLWLAILAVALGVGMIVGLTTLMSGAGGLASPLMVGFRTLVGGAGGLFGAACIGSAYVEFLRLKGGGVGAEATAEVFA